MSSIRIDQAVARFIKKQAGSTRGLKGKPMSVIMAEGLRAFMSKDDKCFSCPHHMEQVAKLELSRQMIAIKEMGNGKGTEGGDAWVSLRKDVHDDASDYSETYRRSIKIIAEQAALEYVTRPGACADCPMEKK
jgi:hypothetical protein